MALGALSHPLGLRHDKMWLVYLSYILLFVGGIMLWICQSNIGSSGDPDIPLFGSLFTGRFNGLVV